MYIAPNIHATEWRRLELADLASPDWIRAIEIGRARIYGRYFDAADLLINAEENLPRKNVAMALPSWLLIAYLSKPFRLSKMELQTQEINLRSFLESFEEQPVI